MNMSKSCAAKIAYLQFVNDQLQTELDDINYLLKTIGFTEGLQTIKAVAMEMIQEDEIADQ